MTLVFTDIEGSTRLWEQHPTLMADALRRHDALLTDVFSGAGGHVFKTVGDAFYVVFDSVSDAVGSVARLQHALATESWPQGVNLRVRVGVHTGVCEERDGDYFGPVVNRVARLEAAACGGQVVLSAESARLARDHLPPGVSLRDLGSHAFRDLAEEERVFQLVFEDLDSDFPPLRAAGRSAELTNLPSARVHLFGRGAELDELEQRLQHSRLVTLTGPGGSGKSALAIELGRRMVSSMEDGVWLVDLAAITDPALVDVLVRQALGLESAGSEEDLAVVLRVVATQERLLILDNCEHLLDAVCVLADSLVASCPRLRIVATSREPLRLEDESVVPVAPLGLPDEDAESLAEALSAPAVSLFLDRVAAQAPGADPRDQDVEAIASICRRLDGMPLAIELAAPRLRTMSFQEVDDGLARRFDLLTQGSRARQPRQQTLQSVVEWSYDQLARDQQALFDRLSVFHGGFTLEAAERVCADDLDPAAIRGLVSELVDKSMVVATRIDGKIRFSTLETLREYGGLRLAREQADGEADVVRLRDAHAAYYTALSLEAPRLTTGLYAAAGFAAVLREGDNLLAAADHLVHLTPTRPHRALGLFTAMIPIAEATGRSATLLDLVDEALAAANGDEGRELAGALFFRFRLLEHLGRYEDAMRCLATATEVATDSGDRQLEVLAKSALAVLTADVALADAALGVASDVHDSWTVLVATINAGMAHFRAQQPGSALSLLDTAMTLARTGQFVRHELVLNEILCRVQLAAGNYDAALRYGERAMDLAARGFALWSRANSVLVAHAWTLVALGHPARAVEGFGTALRRARHQGQGQVAIASLVGLACAYEQLDRPELAARLLGAVDAQTTSGFDMLEPFETAFRDRAVAALAVTLGDRLETERGIGAHLDPRSLLAHQGPPADASPPNVDPRTSVEELR